MEVESEFSSCIGYYDALRKNIYIILKTKDIHVAFSGCDSYTPIPVKSSNRSHRMMSVFQETSNSKRSEKSD